MRPNLNFLPDKLDRIALAAMVGFLVAAPLLLYSLGLGGGFIFDDYPNLVHDPHWRLTTTELGSFLEAVGNGSSGLGGRPLALLTFALDHLRAGPDPAALKLTNISLHALNTVLVFLLLRAMLHMASTTVRRTASVEVFAFTVALGWSLHPLQVSTVLYIVQRMEIGASTAILLAGLTYLRARHYQIRGARSLHWWLVSALVTLVGLGFKETALLAPAFIGVIELCVLRFAGSPSVTRWLKSAFSVATLLACGAFLLVVLPQYAAPGRYEFRDFDLTQRLLTQGPVLVHYLSQILLPIPDRLVFYYDNFPISTSLISPPWTLASWAVLVGLSGIAVLCRHHFPLVSLGIAWFFAGHLLTSNVVPLELAFEHRNYLALLGPLLALADLAARLLSRAHLDARVTAVAAILLTITLLSSLQARTWGEPVRLATALAGRNIESARASYALGQSLFEQSRDDTQSPSWSFARKEFLHASRLNGRSPLPEQALIIMHARDGTALPTDIWQRLQRKYADHVLTPEAEGAIWQLANCRQRPDCPLDERALFDTFIAALDRNPESARLHSIYATFAYVVLQDPDLGIAVMRDAAALAPMDPQFKANLARFLACRDDASSEVDSLVAAVHDANRVGTYTDDLGAIRARREACSPPSSPE